jgi:hypothetical protein
MTSWISRRSSAVKLIENLCEPVPTNDSVWFTPDLMVDASDLGLAPLQADEPIRVLGARGQGGPLVAGLEAPGCRPG